jgi:tetratricopeptide (TPR) repeat protein/transglutaminase-like putative cysteine protease
MFLIVAGLAPVAAAAPPGSPPRQTPQWQSSALDKPAFTATPAELLALARAAPAGDWPVVVLREQSDTSYDDASRATVRSRWVFVVRTQAGVDDWGTIRTQWRPSYQDRPAIRARVIDPSGAVAELDPALITDAQTTGSAPNVLSDRRHIDAPLPRLQVGAVVEEEVATTDREPLLAVGDVTVTGLGSDVPTSSTVVSYSAPATRKAHHVERQLPRGVRVRHQVAGGRESWVYEIAALPENPVLDTSVPGEITLAPYVGISTAASWAAVARGYRAIVDQRIAAGAVTLPAELPRTASLDTLRAIAGWVHRQVRYTGLELGDASLVPWPPAEVVKRGFGDCKDKATLLIALLREAGIRADLALLNTGPGRDVDPELPGVSVFDHAIVRARVDGRDVWIDATDDLAKPGQLPASAQGRRALIVADDTTGLSATPSARSADNAIHEVRTFELPESGTSRVTEVTRAIGVFEAQRRSDFRAMRSEDLPKQYAAHVDSRYGGKVDRVTASDPADLATPFALTVTARDARRAYTATEQLDLWLYPRSTFHELPWEVVSEEAKPAAARTHDFAWLTPHIYEVENRIVVPTGYTLTAATPERTRAIGSATFTERRRIDGQTLIVTLQLDTGKPRLTAAELIALRAGIAELRKEEIHIVIAHTAFALLGAGKPRDAIAECKRLIALHPKEPLHHTQLATVLLRAGAGEAARREARAAVALGPSDADAFAGLGWVLRFDRLGRQFSHDWDRAGSIAALQKAHKLDPEHVGAAIALAEVLQRDSFGRRFEAEADLRGAADAWRAVVAIDKSDDRKLALAETLLWSGQFAEAETVARSAAQSELRDKWLLVAVAGGRGARPAIEAAGTMRTGTARSALIDLVASTLLLLQRYDVARELFAETGSLGRRGTEQATLIGKVTARAPVKQGTADPHAAVRDVLLATVDPLRKTPVFWDAAVERTFRETVARILPLAVRDSGAVRMLGDLAESGAVVQIAGDAGAWRASVESDRGTTQLYFVLEGGMVKLLGDTAMLGGVGRYALGANNAGKQARARKLLDWVRGDLDKDKAARTTAFKAVWGSAMPSSPDAIQLAGAVLADDSELDRAIAIATRCATTVPDGELTCHERLVGAYLARSRWSDTLHELEKIVALRPAREAAMLPLRAKVMAGAGRCDDADKLLDAALAKDPDDQEALASRFRVAVVCRTSSEATQRAEALVKHAHVRAMDLNNVAWYRLTIGSDLPLALDLARRAVAQANGSPHATGTLAALEAESGELDRAIDDLHKSMAQRHATEPNAGEWYIIGRLYEQLGLVDDATAAYKRVTREYGELLLTSYDLAQKRLAAM